ncbi:5-methylcytosine-specific restriction endonuclease system specificity protein McrC [Luminiphilus sp.]|nr:5-methylcytosine-specific restriction endonuclease system specificity protein McrC [Luminiphilus sp.]
MLYASDLATTNRKVLAAAEDNPDRLPDLVSKLLCDAVEARLRNGLTLGFHSVSRPVSRLRGSVDFLETYRKGLLRKGQLHCSFDQISCDTSMNQLALGAVQSCLSMTSRRDIAARCRRSIGWMKTLGVTEVSKNILLQRKSQLQRANLSDQSMVSLSIIALELKIPSEEEGKHYLYQPSRDERWLRGLFEKAVAGFYKLHAKPLGWRVMPGKWLNWQIDSQSELIPELLPKMKTDIFLHHLETGSEIIIDTKFNEILTRGWHRNQTFRSAYVYQMYAYLKSQKSGADEDYQSQAVLLHPSFGDPVDESVTIQGDQFRFKTLDLMSDHPVWKAELLNILSPCEATFAT